MAVDVTINQIQAGYSISKLNENFNNIQEALQDSVSRSGVEPNQMNVDFDMNGNDILNVGTVQAQDITIAGESLEGVVDSARAEADRAEAAAGASLSSANNSYNEAIRAEQEADRALSIADSWESLQEAVNEAGQEADRAQEEADSVSGVLSDLLEKYLGPFPNDAAATTAAGGEPITGQMYWNTDSQALRVYDDGWKSTSISYAGPWSSSATYYGNSAVEYGGSIWVALRENTNVVPTEGADWSLFLPGVSVADGSITREKLNNQVLGYTDLGSGIDLNTVLTPGSYAINGNGQVNGPGGYAIFLNVDRRITTAGGLHNNIKQVARPQSGALTRLERLSNDGGVTWTAWEFDSVTQSGLSLTGDNFKLTYHKARSTRHIKAFGTGSTEVGGGNAGVDTAALQAAIDSQEIIDIAGTVLQINDRIDVDYAGANIGSSIQANRVGDNASSKIRVVDDDLPILFFVSSTNFEASGFRIEGNSGNNTTNAFNFQRPNGSASDIDASLAKLSIEHLGKAFHIYGRGLKTDTCVFGNLGAVGDLDWPANWTPNGQSNDTQESGMRAYEFYNSRFHGCTVGVRNVGVENRMNCRGILMNGVQADIGGNVFTGVAIDSVFQGIVYNEATTIASYLFDLWAGSEKSEFIGFKGQGLKKGSTTRLNRTAIRINPTTAAVTRDLKFIGGSIGPCNRDGFQIFGSGVARNIVLMGINFDRPAIEGSPYAPMSVFNNNGTITEASVKLIGCHYDPVSEYNAPYFLGGTNTSNITLYRDVTTTKPSASAWAQSNVNVVS